MKFAPNKCCDNRFVSSPYTWNINHANENAIKEKTNEILEYINNAKQIIKPAAMCVLKNTPAIVLKYSTIKLGKWNFNISSSKYTIGLTDSLRSSFAA